MTHPRIVVPGATLALARRTSFRKAFLGDWHPLVGEISLYALADAQRHTEVEVHSSVRVVTHHHQQTTPRHQNHAEFLRRVNGDISCALNTLLAREHYDAPRNVFDKRQTHVMRLMDATAQMTQLLYDHLNPVAAGLVEDVRHTPGRHCDFRDWKRGYIDVERPDVYFSKHRPAKLRLRVTPPPLLMQLFDCDLDALVYALERLAKENTRAIRRTRKRDAMGAQKLRRLHPWNEPKTLAEPGGALVPTYRVGARGLVGTRTNVQCAKGITAFRAGHRAGLLSYRAGEPALFPFGTDLMRRHHGVDVAEPDPSCIVTLPGPTLDDVLRDCHERQRIRENDGTIKSLTELRLSVVDEVRAAWNDEVADVVEHNITEFAPRRVTVTVANARKADGVLGADEQGDEADIPTVRVKHRFEAADTVDTSPPNRIITLRDKRRRRRKRPPPTR